jgi:hypothetical protein
VATLVGDGMMLATQFDPFKVMDLVLSFIDTAVDAIGWLVSSKPEWASKLYGINSSLTTILGAANGLSAILHGMAAWMVWTMKGAAIAIGFSAGSIGKVIVSLIVAAVGSVIQAAGQAAVTHGLLMMQDFSWQNNMSVWDWCAGPGRGLCPPEPNGGMPM